MIWNRKKQRKIVKARKKKIGRKRRTDRQIDRHAQNVVELSLETFTGGGGGGGGGDRQTDRQTDRQRTRAKFAKPEDVKPFPQFS